MKCDTCKHIWTYGGKFMCMNENCSGIKKNVTKCKYYKSLNKTERKQLERRLREDDWAR